MTITEEGDIHSLVRGSLWSEVRLAYGLLPVMTLLERHALAADRLLEQAGIARFGLMDPGYTIAIDRELAFMRAAIRALDKPAASLALAEEYRIRGFSVLGLAMQACATPLHMLGLILEYPRLAWGAFDVEARVGADEVVARLVPATRLDAEEGFLAERDIACAKVLFDEVLGRAFPLSRVTFRHPCAGDPDIYRNFFGCPVEFGSDHHSIRCSREAMLQPLPHANPTMLAFYAAQCERMSRAMDQPFRYAQAVESRLARSRPIPDLHSLAQAMFMTPRTLQRRLAAEGASFSALLRDVRHRRADRLLGEASLTLDTIAAELGFSDAVAFSHAYKSWTGVSPRSLRPR